MAEPKGRLVEVFPSIQGEGLQVGAMQLFIRFAGCNLACRNCDTSGARETPATFSLHPWPGRRVRTLANPVSAAELVEAVTDAYPLREFHSISLTGGEPLLQPGFATALAHRLNGSGGWPPPRNTRLSARPGEGSTRNTRLSARPGEGNGLRLFIETNGTLASALDGLLPVVSFWSVDLKLSKGWKLSGKVLQAHQKFVARLPLKGTFLKLVLEPNEDPERLTRCLKRADFRTFPLVIQPFASSQSSLSDWDSFTIMEWIRILTPFFLEVRWIPQIHKMLRIP